MADRIFPNKYQEESLDSELVFKGIDWDNFNQKLAQAKDNKKELDSKVLDIVKELPEDEKQEIENYLTGDGSSTDSEASWASKKMCKECGKQKCACKMASECTCDDKCECDASMIKHAPKREANKIIFDHPDQISAEAVEAAFASGDEQLGQAILAARHERRVRLAKSLEKRIVAENETQLKLAQRKAYREALVNKVEASSKTKQTKEAKKSEDGFLKISELSSKKKVAFAAKAEAAGFPKEYISAMLGESVAVKDNTAPIKEVMASNLNDNVKKTVVSSMVKEATLTNQDYDRLINYWKNELGYGDQEWIDALFTKKYDK